MSEELKQKIEEALQTAFSLGQRYWQQADHEFYSENKKADVTKEKFDALVQGIKAELQSQSIPDFDEHQWNELGVMFKDEVSEIDFHNGMLKVFCKEVKSYDGNGICGNADLQEIKEVYFRSKKSIPDEQMTENISMGELNFLEKSNLEHRYEKETGRKHWTSPVSHGEYAFPTDDYVNWLMRLINILALQHKKERE